jgi:hypothetical protein
VLLCTSYAIYKAIRLFKKKNRELDTPMLSEHLFTTQYMLTPGDKWTSCKIVKVGPIFWSEAQQHLNMFRSIVHGGNSSSVGVKVRYSVS